MRPRDSRRYLEPWRGGPVARNPPTPEAALEELVSGNQRFVTGRLTHHEEDLAILKLHTVDKQEPFATVLSCSDSRVPVELIFDQSIGHIFVLRIAGNIVTPEVTASIEYSGAMLGIKLALVMGHAGCGAVQAAISGKDAPGQISALYPHIQPAVEDAGPNLEATIKANARIQAELLRNRSSVISDLLKDRELQVFAAYYDLLSGKAVSRDLHHRHFVTGRLDAREPRPGRFASTGRAADATIRGGLGAAQVDRQIAFWREFFVGDPVDVVAPIARAGACS